MQYYALTTHHTLVQCPVFLDNLSKPVLEWQNILDSNAARDDGAGSGRNWNSLRCAKLQSNYQFIFYMLNALPATQPTVSKFWRQNRIIYFFLYTLYRKVTISYFDVVFVCWPWITLLVFSQFVYFIWIIIVTISNKLREDLHQNTSVPGILNCTITTATQAYRLVVLNCSYPHRVGRNVLMAVISLSICVPCLTLSWQWKEA